MKNIKKIVIVLLVFILALSTFACKSAIRKFDGKTVIIYKTGYGDKATENDLVLSKIQEKFKADTGKNIDFEIKFVTFTEAQQRYASAPTKNDKFDIMQGTMNIMNGLSATSSDTKLFVDLKDRINNMMPKYKKFIGQENINKSIRYDKTIGLPSKSTSASYWMSYRKDIIDDEWKLDLANATTLEEFELILETIKQKDKTIVPLTGASWAIDRVIKAFAELPEAYHNSYYLDKGGNLESYDDDQVKLNVLNPNFKKYIEIWQRWISKGYISKDATSMQQETADTMFLSQKSYIKADWLANMLRYDQQDFNKQSATKNAVLQMVPLISGVNNNVVVSGENANTFQVMAYSKGSSEAIDLFCQYTEWIFSNPENYRLALYGVENVHYEIIKEKIEIINDNGEKSEQEFEILKPYDKYINLGDKGPYNGLYSFFTVEDDTYRRYTSEQGKKIIQANNKLETAKQTANEMECYTFDLSNLPSKATDAYNTHLSKCDALKNNIENISVVDTLIALFTTGEGKPYIDEMTRQFKEKYAKSYYGK